MEHEWDLVVIGSGGAAFAGAIRARELGQRVLMVEHATTGGTCLNVGCIPSKVLLARSERARLAGVPTLDDSLVAKRALIERLRQSKYVDLLHEHTTQPRFIYVAAAAGAAAAENAFGAGGEVLDLAALPQIVFTSPAVAQAGPTEAEALARGFDVECTVLPLEPVARALVDGDARGLFKLVREVGTGRLVGASILAAGAPDVIQSAVLAIQHGITVDALTRSWAPYLTMAEGFKLAAQSFDRDVTKLSCCT